MRKGEYEADTQRKRQAGRDRSNVATSSEVLCRRSPEARTRFSSSVPRGKAVLPDFRLLAFRTIK